jgi:hypothetical protein
MPYTVADIEQFTDITIDMIKHEDCMMFTAEEGLEKASVGVVPEGNYIVVAVPKSLGMVAKKDNGLNGQVEFDESVKGANGVEVDFDGVAYLLFGELAIMSGERFIYVR